MAEITKEQSKRMSLLIGIINKSDVEYYVLSAPTISDKQYDEYYTELVTLEKETGYVSPTSPTKRVSGDSSGRKKVKLTEVMRSADKVKDIPSLVGWIGNRPFNVSWKADGLTLVVSYDNKGDMETVALRNGDDVTVGGIYVPNIPHHVSLGRGAKGLEVRGELVMPWSAVAGNYETHPRNIASGAIQKLVPDVAQLMQTRFVAYYISGGKYETKQDMFDALSAYGFEVIDNMTVIRNITPERIAEIIDAYTEDRPSYRFPVDGLVFEYNDLAYGRGLGHVEHHDLCRMAYKWPDEEYETTLTSIEAATTRTGLVSFTANFNTVTIDGTKVSRAYLHNINYIRNLKLGIGDSVTVYKANMIIPQIAKNRTQSDSFVLPTVCPACGGELVMRKSEGDIENLFCENKGCKARLVQRFAAYVDKSRMNIDGFAEKSIGKFVEAGYLKTLEDIYKLKSRAGDIKAIYGDVNTNKLLISIERSTVDATLAKFLAGCCIPNVGRSGAKLLAEYCDNDIEVFKREMKAGTDFSEKIVGFGRVLNDSVHAWYKDKYEQDFCMSALPYLELRRGEGKEAHYEVSDNKAIYGKHIAITGSMILEDGRRPIQNREEGLTDYLNARGAYYDSRVTGSTDILIIGAGARNPSTKMKDADKYRTQTMTFDEFWKMSK